MAAAHATSGSLIPDEELVGQVVQGDGAAFQILYDRYFGRVYAFVQRRLRNRADVEETVQEVFINVFSSIGSYRGEAPLAAWVLGLSRRTIASRFKKKRHVTVPLEGDDQPHHIDPLVPTVRREPSPLEHYECGERIERLQLAARQLSHEQRELFELHHLQNRSIQEIARTLEKSEDSVKSNLYRARKLLLAR